MREDGAFVEAGENDNLIVQKLEANPTRSASSAISFLDQNLDQLQGSRDRRRGADLREHRRRRLPGVPLACTSTSRTPIVDVIPGIKEYVEEFTSEAAIGEDGYLADKGLIPLPEDELKKVRRAGVELHPADHVTAVASGRGSHAGGCASVAPPMIGAAPHVARLT